MKALIAPLLLAASFAPQAALAWCDNPATGKSRLFDVAIFTVSGCNPNDQFPEGTEVIQYTPTSRNSGVDGETLTVPLAEECRWTATGKGLSCAKRGRTPLAGATYITTKDMKDICDETGKTRVERLTCVKGCDNGKAPKHIEGSPWEC